MPRCTDPAGWAAALNPAMTKFAITGQDRAAAFLAQVAHESSELTRLEENLNYTAPRLMAVWPKRFPTLEVANKYAMKPQTLAEYVYGGRMGNRPEGAGDGWNFRGRGPIMLTGATAYALFGRRIGDPMLQVCPARAQIKTIGALIAAAFWSASPRLNVLAEDLADDDDAADFDAISRIVNGGAEGLVKRRAYYAKFREVLGVASRAA
jgi:putative chitinase